LLLHALAKKTYHKVLTIAHKVDPRHGKRPLPSDEPEEKEEDHTFPVYSARSQQDMDVMVSALAQVIGSSHNSSAQVQENPLTSTQSSTENDQTQPAVQDQGIMHIYNNFWKFPKFFLSYPKSPGNNIYGS
jgi:hypothetical protein